jgi:3-dehydroquinate dehydratase/shikimate dehydrogenase
MIRELESAGKADADMVELRLDYLKNWEPSGIDQILEAARNFKGQVIATYRPEEEGGHYTGDEGERLQRLRYVADSGAVDYLDVEFEAWRSSPEVGEQLGLVPRGKPPQKRPPVNLILSKHDFEKTPWDLPGLLSALAFEPADVVKIACKAETIMDSMRMLDAIPTSVRERPTIALSMGETGLLTRILGRKFNAFVSFASLQSGKESAPGQPSLAETRDVYRWDAIGPDTEVYGVIGCPVAHSMSPDIHNAAFRKMEHDAVYLPMRVEPEFKSFAAFVGFCLERPWLDLRGCSVTIPHKENLLRFVEQRGGEIEPLTQRIGVANTLCIDPGQREDGSDAKIRAYNTDYRGALDALCQGMNCSSEELKGRSVAVLGAGGASRAVIAGLTDSGCKVTIYNRTGSKAEQLAGEFNAQARPWDQRNQLDEEIIINCTSIGMWPKEDTSPLPEVQFSSNQVVFDTVYNPIETQLLKQAREADCTVVDGVAMFVNQAAAQFERWTGKKAPVDIMREVVIKRLSEKQA